MLRRRSASLLLVLLAVLGISAAVYAQLETADRGILPIDSSGTLEITGIHVDVGGPDAQSARFAGWRIAQRQGFRALWAKMHHLPINQAPTLSDSVLDTLVSSIIVEREQIGPNRYIADLGILFDRSRAGQLLGVAGQTQRSQPMLLIPVTVTGGTATSVELKNAWQRAWAQFRTSQSPIDYVRVSGLGVDPILINAAQTERPGRGWWRNIVDLYGAADILVAEVSVQRAFPGGPARARFIARHGPDNEIIGGFTLTAANSEGIPAMMNQGVQRMDEIFQTALAAGQLQRDPTLDIPEPPPLPEDLTPEAPKQDQSAAGKPWTYQVQIVSPDPQTYNFAVAHIRTLANVDGAQVMAVNIGGISYVHVSYRGNLSALAAGLAARGWTVQNLGTVIRISGNAGPPPKPPAPAAAPAQPTPVTPAPAAPSPAPGQPAAGTPR
ncbi:MAG: heavy-metal-associated domain-containing protein [Sphingomicrobium sp.]